MTDKIRELINNMRALREAATPGPWQCDKDGDVWSLTAENPVEIQNLEGVGKNVGTTRFYSESNSDACFIAASPENQALLEAALLVAVEALEEFKLGHEHAPGLPHTRAMGNDYGWCDHCHSKVHWGIGDAEKSIQAIEAALKGKTS